MNYYEYTTSGGGGGGNVTIVGSTIEVPVTTSAGKPIEITGSVYILNPGGGSATSVTITNPLPLPVTSSPGNPVIISGDVNSTVANWPASQVVTSSNGNPVRVTGTITATASISNWPTAQNVTASIANPVAVVGTVSTQDALAGTGTFTTSNVSNISTLVLDPELTRRGAMIFNTTTTLIYIAYGFTATTTNYSVKLPANGLIEVPFSYCGAINAVAASSGPFILNVTEFT